MPKIELDGLPVIDAPESEEITIVISADDMQAGDMKKPERHPIAIALRRKRGVDDARVSKREVLIRRGDQWYRYEPPKAPTELKCKRITPASPQLAPLAGRCNGVWT